MFIPIVIFPFGRLKSSHLSPSPLRLSYFQIPRTCNRQTLRIDRTSGLEISCLLCALAYAFHSHPHTKQLSMYLSPWRIRSFVFMVLALLSGHEHSLGEAMVLLVLRVQIDSFRRHETRSSTQCVWALDPDSLFSNCSSRAKRMLYSSV